MALKLGYGFNLLLFFAPLIGGLSVANSSIFAATLASSTAAVSMENFSTAPLGITTNAQMYYAVSQSGEVSTTAIAWAIANFNPNQPPQGFFNFSNSRAAGEGSNYLGLAQSMAGIIGYDFSVAKGQNFSFDFNLSLKLETSIDSPPVEGASASGEVFFELRDSNDWSLLDSLSISGNIKSLGDDYIDTLLSDNIKLNSDSTPNKSFGGKQEYAYASLIGKFSRKFDRDINLTLIEVKRNEVLVKAPEPNNTVAIFSLCLIGIGLDGCSKLKRKTQLASTHATSKI
jgi:hypothetical protein